MVSEDSDLHKEIQVDLVKNVTGQYTMCKITHFARKMGG